MVKVIAGRVNGVQGAVRDVAAGKPLRESIAWRGPIVMNTQAELRTAFQELDRGTFIKHARGAAR